jgi:hypothetical protein
MRTGLSVSSSGKLLSNIIYPLKIQEIINFGFIFVLESEVVIML